MSRVEEGSKEDIEARCETLRARIKDFEYAFEEKKGRKVTVDYIKARPAIANKYAEYEKLRALLKGEERLEKVKKKSRQISAQEQENEQEKAVENNKKRGPDETNENHSTDANLQQTPSKKRRTTSPHLISTPKSHRKMDPPTHPASHEEQTPQKPVILGPTPQKDGVILDIFDCLDNASTYAIPGTPSRIPLVQVSGNGTINIAVPMTPSKTQSPERDEYESRRYSRTPMSEGKKFMLSQYLTPQKSGGSAPDFNSNQQKSPSSIAKQFATPSFLRQYMDPVPLMDTVLETEEQVMIEKSKRPSILHRQRSKPFVGYRAMIKERDEIVKEQMRVEEERRADEDEEILRGIMEEEEGLMSSVNNDNTQSKEVDIIPETQFDDILAAVLDDDGFLNDDVETELRVADEEAKKARGDGYVAQVYKKKGQKRTTRRVIMRPTKAKPSTSVVGHDEESEEDNESKNGDVSGNENQPVAINEESTTTSNTRRSVKTVPKKVNPQDKKTTKRPSADHANYRKLKIKNQNSKAKRGGKWGSRRR